jgi:peptidyl-dipeptidase A
VKADPRDFIDEINLRAAALEKAFNLAEWEAAVNATPEATLRTQKSQEAMLRYWSDPARFERIKALRASPPADPLLARQIELIYLQAARSQQDERTIERVAEGEAQVHQIFSNFRGKIGDRRLSDNEIDSILSKSRDSDEVRQTWEASKQIGAELAGLLRRLAHLRNAAARISGFRDYFQRALELDELDEPQLLALFDSLDQATQAPYRALKDQIDHLQASRFGIAISDLLPWHFADRFFQRPPAITEIDMDGLFSQADPVTLALATYDGLGMDVRDVLDRSDLYPRPAKNQHAFCTDIDRSGDVRTLNNLDLNLRWNETLHHELGHAVYFKYIDPNLPWLLRAPSHTLTTEAIAQLMGGVLSDDEWLKAVLGIDASEAARVSAAANELERAKNLIFIRWSLVMTQFERRFYADPDGDLDDLWWNLVERYQLIRRPPGRHAPDWASKFHIGLAPVYYHNYVLGLLVSAQIDHHVRRNTGGFIGRPAAGEWLKQRIFRPGASQDWAGHIATATGEPLKPDYFVAAVSRG